MANSSREINRLIQSQQVFSIIFAGEKLPEAIEDQARELFDGQLVGLSVRLLKPGQALKLVVTHDTDFPREECYEELKALARRNDLNYAIFPNMSDAPEFRLAIMDMDSTLINEEVIEELAAFAGVREHVTKVTTLAMEGKLDFQQALRERVKLLAGQPASILQEVYEKHITPTPGLTEMIAGFAEQGIRTCVVSGGFISIVEPFAKKVGIDTAIANVLEVEDGKLTGNVLGEIVDSEVKKRTLLELCQQYRCDPCEAIAIGDGANDLKMLSLSGLGIAFCAKPIVQEQAFCAINRRRLDDVLLFLS